MSEIILCINNSNHSSIKKQQQKKEHGAIRKKKGKNVSKSGTTTMYIQFVYFASS